LAISSWLMVRLLPDRWRFNLTPGVHATENRRHTHL